MRRIDPVQLRAELIAAGVLTPTENRRHRGVRTGGPVVRLDHAGRYEAALTIAKRESTQAVALCSDDGGWLGDMLRALRAQGRLRAR